MKKIHTTHRGVSLAVILLATAFCRSAIAAQGEGQESYIDYQGGRLYKEANATGKRGRIALGEIVSDSALSQMRGGFINPTGVRINFGFDSTTLIDGVVKSSFSMAASNVNAAVPADLKQVIQAGANNNLSAPMNSGALAGNIVNIVQNTQNNKVVQVNNMVNVTVSNIAVMRMQNVAMNANFNRAIFH